MTASSSAWRRATGPVFLALMLATFLAFSAAPAQAATPIVPGGGWIAITAVSDEAPVDQSPFTFTSAVPVRITIVDILCRGDEWTVFDGALSLGPTSDVPAYGASLSACLEPLPVTADPDVAILDSTYSSGSWTVLPGTHSIGVFAIEAANGPTEIAGLGYIRFDEVEGPFWDIRMTVGGGNVYNPNLPAYTLDTWSTKNVGLYLFCMPGDAPIDLVRADRSVVFKDGIHSYSTKPTDECIDELGRAAEPLLNLGPIKVDTKAPNCRITPATVYVPRNTSQTVVWATDFDDTGSGFNGLSASTYGSGGATMSVVGINGFPVTTWTVDVTMGASTSSRVTTDFLVHDVAGNTATCTALARAK